MGRVTLHLDRLTEERLRAAANAAGISMSQWVAHLIRQQTAPSWPSEIASLVGARADDFPSLEEIRGEGPDQPPREPF
jgi:hypothetical protein